MNTVSSSKGSKSFKKRFVLDLNTLRIRSGPVTRAKLVRDDGHRRRDKECCGRTPGNGSNSFSWAPGTVRTPRAACFRGSFRSWSFVTGHLHHKFGSKTNDYWPNLPAAVIPAPAEIQNCPCSRTNRAASAAVIPAPAGIQNVLRKPSRILDSRRRGNDGGGRFFWIICSLALLDAFALVSVPMVDMLHHRRIIFLFRPRTGSRSASGARTRNGIGFSAGQGFIRYVAAAETTCGLWGAKWEPC